MKLKTNLHRIIIPLMTLLLIGVLAGCAEEKGGKDAILQQLEAANTNEALLENNDRAAFRYNFYLADGTMESTYAYKDEERYVLEDAYGILIDENGDVYGFDNETKLPYRQLFMNNTYEEQIGSGVPLAGYAYEKIEKVVSSEEKDGVIYVKTEFDSVESFEESITYGGYDVAAVEKVSMEYEIDVATREILKMSTKLITKDGELVLQETTRDTDCEKYQPDEQLLAGVFGEDMRTVTLITDADTDKEKQHSQTIAKGGQILVIFDEDFESALYLDPECTQKFENAGDYESDAVYYLKRVK